jgi:hypothetical protein
MLLEVEKKAPVENAVAADVRAVIPKLRSYGPSSYASLTDAQGSYLQVAGGGVTCMLEWRDAVNRRHFRAHLDASSKVFPDGTILTFSGGEVKLRADEWLTAPMVEEAFLAFLRGQSLPPSIKWRDISAMFDDLA